jgi:hypothetical protein
MSGCSIPWNALQATTSIVHVSRSPPTPVHRRAAPHVSAHRFSLHLLPLTRGPHRTRQARGPRLAGPGSAKKRLQISQHSSPPHPQPTETTARAEPGRRNIKKAARATGREPPRHHFAAPTPTATSSLVPDLAVRPIGLLLSGRPPPEPPAGGASRARPRRPMVGPAHRSLEI